MEGIVTLVVLGGLAWYLYRCGKRTGSRKAFGIGLARGRRSRRYRRS